MIQKGKRRDWKVTGHWVPKQNLPDACFSAGWISGNTMRKYFWQNWRPRRAVMNSILTYNYTSSNFSSAISFRGAISEWFSDSGKVILHSDLLFSLSASCTPGIWGAVSTAAHKVIAVPKRINCLSICFSFVFLHSRYFAVLSMWLYCTMLWLIWKGTELLKKVCSFWTTLSLDKGSMSCYSVITNLHMFWRIVMLMLL